jgi:uncharacterized tellurite resistance protein B-like protein
MSDIWDKYRKERQANDCVLSVSSFYRAKLCKADGHFSKIEEEEILKIVPHEKYQRKILIKILEEANDDQNPIENDAKNLKALLKNDHRDFLEFIIAALYKLAHSDHVYSEEEDDDIRAVAKIFGIDKSFYQKSEELLKNTISNSFKFMKKNEEKLNA